MKKTVLLLSGLCILALCSCEEQPSMTMDQVHQLEDSVAKAIPSVTAIHTVVKGSKDLYVIIGDATFINANAEKQQEKAIQIGAMALHIVGPDNGLKTGQLIVAKELKDAKDIPADGIKTDMKIDSLQKVIYNK